MTAIDLDRLIDVVRELAAQHPSREASDRYLDNDGVPVCIIGHAFVAMGRRDSLVEGVPVRALPGVDSDDSRAMWLEYVQEHQDGGETWAAAVELADMEPEP